MAWAMPGHRRCLVKSRPVVGRRVGALGGCRSTGTMGPGVNPWWGN